MEDSKLIPVNVGQLRMLIGFVTELIHMHCNDDSAYENDYLPHLVSLLMSLTCLYSDIINEHATSKFREDSKDN